MTIPTEGLVLPKMSHFLNSINRSRLTLDGEIRNIDAPATLAKRISTKGETLLKETDIAALFEFELSIPDQHVYETERAICVATPITPLTPEETVEEILTRLNMTQETPLVGTTWYSPGILNEVTSSNVKFCRLYRITPEGPVELPNSYVVMNLQSQFEQSFYFFEQYDLDSGGTPIDTPMQILTPRKFTMEPPYPEKIVHVTRFVDNYGIRRLKKMSGRDTVPTLQLKKAVLRPPIDGKNVQTRWTVYNDSCGKTLGIMRHSES
jgi:hypothetical protein